jgi:hypothetical protein
MSLVGRPTSAELADATEHCSNLPMKPFPRISSFSVNMPDPVYRDAREVGDVHDIGRAPVHMVLIVYSYCTFFFFLGARGGPRDASL